MNSRHEVLFMQAELAINQVFADTTVSAAITQDSLELLKARIEELLAALELQEKENDLPDLY